MRYWKHLLGLLVLALVLTACTAPAANSTAEIEISASPTVVSPTDTVVPPTEQPSATPVNTPTELAAVNYCLDCHTDKDELIRTAKPEEYIEKESEGAG
jgi:hypothetical protein